MLEQLIEEHEEAKINLILNGFEHVFIEEKAEESIVLNYYDTLRNLRYLDIKRLFYLADETNDFTYESKEEEALILNVDFRLQNMGLIGVIKRGFTLGGGFERETEITKEDVKVLPYLHYLASQPQCGAKY
ncbi:hypothetical protein [Salicibibacter kimchii]|uniref:Uncharacterized protein n=1 Tax=Salicibibacter kimchii TaxID=2099786 RepID=A0A345C2M3_9BACI|nr:hypothetical protein [Salicibibacter kimchii]AXF57454.1 hypothetical protein DT065_16650 [Salicibibacter kimchii]